MESRGEYFDGQSAACKHVVLRLKNDCLQIDGDGLELQLPYSELRLSDALGSVSRSIYLPDGGKCDIRNRVFAAELQKKLGRGGFFNQVHRFENSLRLAAIALLLTAVVVWAFIRFGIPVLAERMAYAIPPSAEVSMGKEAFEFLDSSFFSETGLPKWRQLEVEQLFNQVVSGMEQDQRDYQLLFRDSAAFGANALALPGGTVIVTDDFMALVDRDEELIAVLAHEIGHIRNRHALRKIIQSSTAGLLVAAITGDILSSGSIAAALPTMLVDAKYSRDMEREADDAAVEYMLAQGIPLHHLADVLLNLQRSVGGEKEGSGEPSALRYLSTHPATQERIERLSSY
ncbi:Peptidase family M48 [Malonomonas rubra DSM 5091]|uniref:Peptidase family M48 n=1 Tax=Malonomonas rubra DSM 5091 TaxID=1122189 RepID=A0A1M6I4G9_MALRU|nr:M48 family metallopeptidase [Malonomonas rubra]SHJ29348.1 Peptidase family M48 [Malonomonas rubra DSM 5091]